MERVLPSETVKADTLDGMRCWHCWAGEGDEHQGGCIAPWVTARDNLKAVIAEALTPCVEWFNERLRRMFKWDR